jgi:L-fuconolactonase
MRIVDAHQHFWKYDTQIHGWIDKEMLVLQKDFMPSDLKIVFEKNQVDACVSIQVDQTKEETLFQIECAKSNAFIKGIVGWIDLFDNNIEETLYNYKENKTLKGFRYILQGKEKDFMLQPKFISGLKKLATHNYTYDLLIYNNQLNEAIELLKELHNLPIVLNHIAKPNIKNQDIQDWNKQISAISKFENLSCKISGLVTEADWANWTEKDLYPYLDIIIDSFGIDRVMFGSDWPVCLLASSYEKWLSLLKSYFSRFSTLEQEKFFALNCESFYKLDD